MHRVSTRAARVNGEANDFSSPLMCNFIGFLFCSSRLLLEQIVASGHRSIGVQRNWVGDVELLQIGGGNQLTLLLIHAKHDETMAAKTLVERL